MTTHHWLFSKIAMVLLLLLGLCASSCVGDEKISQKNPGIVDVSGSWTGKSPGPSAANPTAIVADGYIRTYHFQQDGERLSGTLHGISQFMASQGMSSPPVVLEDGKVQGHTISFAWHTRNVSFDLRWTSEGTIDGDTITLVDKMNGATPPIEMAQPYTIRRLR